MTDVLSLQDVTVVRGGKKLLDSASLTVKEGERWVVMGPNGAGKTTLLQMAAARLHPTSGTAEILGETMGRVDVFELRPRVGLASSSLTGHIPDDEKVLDAVVTAAYGVTGRWREEYERFDERRAFMLLEKWGVGTLFHRRFGQLSEGEKKRVQIARALMTDPELLLLDEPGGGLDLGGREDLVARLNHLARNPDSPAMVVVTHHVEEVPPGFTHAALMADGKVVHAGEIDSVLTDEKLSEVFDMPLQIREVEGRRFASAR
ncbi:ABC transporter ATP-binding protein [Arthrobacter sp. UM1]|uniref:ABC transporter ATP-binding protein n=1 Tax=Arthrobacter sp. UM1 TaxID=2766776 RepID=UPI001CF67D4D|nr:ATP-binding cassette domain-containing protein [Arthrobacter sp. UM1]MCB4207477.1 ATP-binding cassette domain-containing protein [Arthrobacter sp. UM1]